VADVAGAQRLAGGGDPAGDAFAGAKFHPLGAFAQAVAGFDVEQAGIRVDQDEGAGVGAGGADGGGEDAVERFLGMEQRAQIAPAQFGEERGRVQGASCRDSLAHFPREGGSTSSDPLASIFLPFRSQR
jgi:hypothetical protein